MMLDTTGPSPSQPVRRIVQRRPNPTTTVGGDILVDNYGRVYREMQPWETRDTSSTCPPTYHKLTPDGRVI